MYAGTSMFIHDVYHVSSSTACHPHVLFVSPSPHHWDPPLLSFQIEKLRSYEL